MKDAIVIGKGPAGISAAIYLKRAGLDVMVIGKGFGSLEKSEKIENYYGFETPINGRELVEKGIRQAENLGIKVLTDEVINISKESDFIVKTTSETFESKTVMIATGKSRVRIDIDGFENLRGKGISFCAVCDGFFYRNKRLAVIGNGDYAAEELRELTAFSKDITLFTNGEKIQSENFPQDISIITDKILKISGEDMVTGIVTDKNEYKLDGIFVAVGTASALDFAMKLGVFVEKDDIIVDDGFMTNVDGLFAAGDAIGGFMQIAKADSDGAHASRSMIKYIKQSR